MFERCIMIGAFNPLHFGHVYIMKNSLNYSRVLDVYAGKKKSVDKLPQSLRDGFLDDAIEHEDGFSERVFRVDADKATVLNGLVYDCCACGSDLLNIMFKSSNEKVRKKYGEYFLSLKNILVAQRGYNILEKRVVDVLEQSGVNLFVSDPGLDISSTRIRSMIKAGEDISDLVPWYVEKKV